MKREKGSITLFSLISLLLITAALFALLEGTRLQEMYRFADLQQTLILFPGLQGLQQLFRFEVTCILKLKILPMHRSFQMHSLQMQWIMYL